MLLKSNSTSTKSLLASLRKVSSAFFSSGFSSVYVPSLMMWLAKEVALAQGLLSPFSDKPIGGDSRVKTFMAVSGEGVE